MIVILLVKIVGFSIPVILMLWVLKDRKKKKHNEFKKYWEHQEVPGNYYDVLVEKNPGIVPKKVMLN
ncbi:MAG: hypothetical protein ACNS60_19130 [Candidatus Cyclobacteriaceae bacterium M2_1C_046]